MVTNIADNKLLNIKKELFDELHNKYILVKNEYDNDRYNYNKIIKYDKQKKYIKQLLEIEKINKFYFFPNKNYMPTTVELGSINILMEKLWQIDSNKFIFNKDFRLNTQGKINKNNFTDESPYPLFEYANLKKFKTPTYKYFLKISKFFSREIGVTETETEYKTEEIMKFINAMCNTQIFLYLYYFLSDRKIVNHLLDFPKYIYELWFGSITKKSINDSSAFEHIFIGEVSDKKILGFHNWIQFYMEEKIGRINYYGHNNDVSNNFPYIMEITFAWENRVKSTSTMFIGMSPEFELALYTICYHLSGDSNMIEFKINNDHIRIMVIKRDNKLITAYPIMLKN